MNFKATMLACATFLAGIAIIITYASQQDRYAIFSQDKAIFVFDRKNATLNFCNDHACQLITPYVAENGVMPSQMALMNGQPVTQAMMQQAGIIQMSQTAQPFVPQMSPQSSLQAPAAVQGMVGGMQPQQIVLMAAPQQQPMKAPVAAAVSPATAPASPTATTDTAPAAAPAADATPDAAPADTASDTPPADASSDSAAADTAADAASADAPAE